jgi:hypothetical protein
LLIQADDVPPGAGDEFEWIRRYLVICLLAFLAGVF